MDEGEEPVDIPVEVTGAFLTNPNVFFSPVVVEYGTTDPTFFLAHQPTDTGEFGPQNSYNPIPLSYLFNIAKDSPRFKSFSLPELDPTRTYRVWVQGNSQIVSGGDVVDFSTDYPEGVSRILIDGLDEKGGDGQLPDVFGVTFATVGVARFLLAEIYPTVGQSHVYHAGSSFASESFEAALDSEKSLAQEGTEPVTLGYENLINSSRGINGLVFDIHNLQTSSLSEDDFLFQVSPSGIFEDEYNPPTDWQTAAQPSTITVVPGTPSQVILQWPDNAIANRWLRVSVLANENTRLAKSEVFYLGHLLGETTGISDESYTVSFADITPIRSQVGNNVDASSSADIDKSGTITFADISAMRSSVGNQLSNITIPAGPEN